MTIKMSLWFVTILLSGCGNSELQFALIGDNPYGEDNLHKYENLIEDINSSNVSWVVHLGDLKNGISNCSDEKFLSLYELNSKFRVPFVLTPGDNDWFDCRRESAGNWGRMNRLNKLREIFFREEHPLGAETQSETSLYSEFVENALWVAGDVLFSTVHLVGVSGREGGLDLHGYVQDAAIDWLQTIFQRAREQNVKAVFIATQADFFPYSVEPDWLNLECPDCNFVRKHYEPFYEALKNELSAYDNQVLLAVGDTHIFRVDKPLYDKNQLVINFTRVEVFGSEQVHWVRVSLSESDAVFVIEQEFVEGN